MNTHGIDVDKSIAEVATAQAKFDAGERISLGDLTVARSHIREGRAQEARAHKREIKRRKAEAEANAEAKDDLRRAAEELGIDLSGVVGKGGSA